jgi:hypothetical protein
VLKKVALLALDAGAVWAVQVGPHYKARASRRRWQVLRNELKLCFKKRVFKAAKTLMVG